jgi:hypothetical protein
VAGVLVGGQGKSKPFLLVEWHDGVAEEEKTVEAIWPTVDKVNGEIAEKVKIEKGMIIMVEPEKKLVRTGKRSIAKRESIAAYNDEIEALYD